MIEAAASRPTVASHSASERSAGLHRLAVVAAAVLVIGVMAWRAWVCDDAYITLRTVDNWVHGFGLRYNVAERVQSYTHPLWLLLVSSAYVVTREPYYTILGVSLVVSAASVVAFARAATACSWQGAVAGLLLMLASRAFVDFSTSGLENPLSHLLMIVLAGQVLRGPRSVKDGTVLCGTAALLACNRLDLVVISCPLVWAGLLPLDARDRVRALVTGMVPLAAWLAFATIYYGFPLPNTAYSKLGAVLWDSARVKQGVAYLLESAVADPATLATVGCAVGIAARREAARSRLVALALLTGVGYVVWAGGDFMSGRFLTPAFVVALVVVGEEWWSLPGLARRAMFGFVIGVLVLRVADGALREELLGPEPLYRGIVDECRAYSPHTNLWSGVPGRAAGHPWAREGRQARELGTQVVIRGPIGFFGYFAGPDVHLVDLHGLVDPLVARLPVSRLSRVGHPLHAIPAGYIETLSSGRNLLQDRQYADYYEDLALLTRGPIWGGERWAAILRLNLRRPPWPVFIE